MTSTKDVPGSWLTRPGSMIDVNAVARLLRSAMRPLDIDGDGILDGPTDHDAADTAARLLLLHSVLEHGRLWVAEREGRPVAAAIWVPGGAATGGATTGGDELGGILRRELQVDSVSDVAALIGPDEHVRPFLEDAMASASGAVERARLVLYGVVIDPAVVDDLDVVALARELVAPVVSELDGEGESAYALALDPARAALLEAAGFRRVDAIPFGAGHTVWVGRALHRAPLPA